jgi:capsular polysaccharide transport system ATP-binding protein
MIRINNVTKFYMSKQGKQFIFNKLSFDIPSGHNIAILGKNGAGKSTLFRLIAKSEYPSKGKIETDLNISWPVALATGIHPQMTGRENARFIGRINGIANLDLYEKRVQEYSELKNKFDLPVSGYSSGMRPRLAFACCIAIDFDIYLIDEVLAVGDANFRRKAKASLLEKSKKANIIMVSHDVDEIRMFCDSAIVIENGELTFFNDIDEGIAVYEAQ